jgi:transcriptional regulator with XRE-family HTH domain
LGAELRRLRESAGRTVADVAGELEWSESKLSRIETAVSGVSDTDIGRLLRVYGLGEAETTRLARLASESRRRIRRSLRSAAISDAFEKYLSLEEEATTIYMYAVAVVPGILQTPEYAGAVIRATPEPEDEEVATEVVTTRMARQAILARQPPPRLNVIVDEAVLCRPVGGHEVMRRQMLRLIEASERPTTTIRVLPFSAGAHAAVVGPFDVVEFEGGTVPPHVFCDGLTGGVLRSVPSDVAVYLRCFEILSDLALSKSDSVDLIAATAGGARGRQRP